ncbi:VirK/YbjX family protein [Luteibacter sp.]|uniref:VirK/YbjX family protein n=1 Tax=Luteibacter sp. TaxID=1886636 RepID=UPI003F7E2B9D
MQSLFRFVRSLHGRAGWHSTRSHAIGAVLTYCGRSLKRWREHDAWLAFLESPAMAGITESDAVLIERYQHRYISKAWSPEQRLAAVRGHYEFALAHFPREMFHMLYRERQVLAGKLALRDGSELSLLLKAPIRRGREGELSLSLTDATGLQLSYAQFSIINGGRTIVIGCLQGAANNAGREAVRELTKQCHGLRPKNLLLSMVRAIATAYGIDKVLGVGNGRHVFAGIANKVKADYDAFWLEAGGEAVDAGFYRLPPRDPLRLESEVESKRRSEFRRREALRREACELIVQPFGFHRPLLAAAA